MMERQSVVVIGGGPAGLTAAYELTKFGRHPLVLEKRSKVGGLAATENHKGFSFDLGGHRFFTKSEEVKKMWHEILPRDLLRRPRLSRIYYRGRFFHYPLKPLNVLRGLGLWQSVLIALSYLRWQLLPHPHEDTFEQWVTNRFGRRLFRTFFKTYTEKVWGVPCSELRAEWAAQRINDLSLKTVLLNMFVKPRRTIKSLIEEFDYPRLGPGMMWTAVKEGIERRGGVVRLNCDVVRIQRIGTRIDNVVVTSNGQEVRIPTSYLISGMLAVRNLVLGQQNDLWSVNADQDYHEEVRDEAYLEGRRAEEILDATLSRTFSKLHQLAFGTAVGIVSLSLLGQFFIGYRVTLAGSLIGLGYAVVVGFLGGYFIAIRYNWSVDLMERRRRGDA